MYAICLKSVLLLFCLISLVIGHARIKYPRPLAAAPENPGGNYYNNPLRADGSDFPCKGLHKRADVNKQPTATWGAGEETYFEILGHGTSGGEGSLAAHSGGSCQASLSFDNGETWKVLHSYTGGCPRGVRLGSNIASTNQTFRFTVPINTKAGVALFSWSWIAVTGNRNEYYQNCASVMITGSGTSTLDDLPDMFVGDMTLTGHIGPGECRSTIEYALEYPNPGAANTIVEMPSIRFKRPTNGKCFAKGTVNNSTTSRPSSSASSSILSSKLSTTTAEIKSSSTSASKTTSRTSSTSTKPTTSTTTRSSSTSTRPTTPKASSTSKMLTSASTTTTPEFGPLPIINGLPGQCTKYTLITDHTRHSSYPGYIGCDNAVFKKTPTWVRFSGAAGTRLVHGPAQPFRCGTQGAGWHSGSYPSKAGDTISAKVCYSWPGNSCQWSNSISITNCNGYYVFALPAPPACFLRYCTS